MNLINNKYMPKRKRGENKKRANDKELEENSQEAI